MLKQDLIYKNPLRIFDSNDDNIIENGEFGAVIARAGVGKTALLVQIALNSLLLDQNVLHISISDTISKVCLWYEEVFRNITNQFDLLNINELWETILSHRFIMTFQSKDFSVRILEQRITELTEQGIFYPQLLLIDSLSFDENIRDELNGFKEIATSNRSPIWFTIRSHRHEEPDQNGFPPQFAKVSDLFKVAMQIRPEGDKIHIRLLKGKDNSSHKDGLLLDPSSMLIK